MDAGVKFVIDSDTKKLNAGLRSSEKEMNSLEKTSEETTKSVEGIEEAGNGLNALSLAGLTAALAVVGQAAKDILVDVTNVAIEFDTGMRKVSTLLDENAKGSQDWGSAFKSAAIETGQSLTDVTDATYQAISAGIEHADSIEFVTSQNKLAIGGQTDLSSAIDVTTKTLNAYGLTAQDATKINDILIATQNNGITTVDELSASLANVTPTAAAMGVSFDQVGAALATMTAQGTPTAQATTQLNTLLAELGKSGTTASKIFGDLTGQTFQDFIASGGDVGQAVTLMTKDLEAAGNEIQMLVDTGMTYDEAFAQVVATSADAEQGMIDMFGSVEAAKAALQLSSQEGEVFAGNMEAMANSAGSAEQAFADMTEGSPEFALNQMSSATEAFKATLGEQLLPALLPIIEAFGAFAKKLSENETMAKVLVAILITVAVTFTILSVAIGIMAIQAFLASIAVNAMLWPILLVAVAIGALIAVVILFKDKIALAWDWIKQKTIAFVESLKKIISTAWEWIKDNWQTILTVILTITFGIFGLIVGLIIKYKDQIIATIKAMWDKVKQLFELAKTNLIAIVTAIKTTLINIWNTVKQSIINIVNSLWNMVKNTFDAGKNKVVSIITAMKTSVLNAFNAMKNGISNIINGIISSLTKFVNKVLSIKDTIVGAFKNMISGISVGIQTGIDKLISTIKSGVNTFAINPLNTALGVINKIPGVNIPTIPALAKGGIVGKGNDGIFANVGEAGPEAVIPLKDSVLSKIGNQILGATGFGNQTTNNAGNKINIEINVPVGANLSDFKTATEEVLRQLTLEGAL